MDIKYVTLGKILKELFEEQYEDGIRVSYENFKDTNKEKIKK